MPKPAPLLERLKNALGVHPDWSDYRISRAIRGSKIEQVRAIRDGKDSGISPDYLGPDRTPKAQDPPPAPTAGGGVITLDQVRRRYDIASLIREELNKLPPGDLILERELCLRTAGKDAARFRRSVENTEDLKPNRVKLKLDPDSPDGAWYWGTAETIAKAKAMRDE